MLKEGQWYKCSCGDIYKQICIFKHEGYEPEGNNGNEKPASFGTELYIAREDLNNNKYKKYNKHYCRMINGNVSEISKAEVMSEVL